MSYPPPSGGWHDPSRPGPQSSPPADPTMPMAGSPIPSQPSPADPYAAPQPPSAPPAGDPYAAPGYPPAGGDPYAAPGYPPAGGDPYAAPGYPPTGGDPYAAGGYPPPAYPPYGHPSSKTNTLAIVALVLSLVGFASCITAPIGAIMGHVARKQIRETGEQGEGMAKAAIIVGWILTALMLVLIVVYVGAIIFAISNADTGGSTPTF
ncbi:DUF4190 domain-containing protein [Micromonospora sp. DR5-3]|uniref:DUF4190 domain-containing protein n=1 Tax=unclassified Micromonospora TaxID=2617518 RepID=UPI0011DB3272|nr:MULTISPECIES: DUF4190 domain-containing protein [unclassified Micromonospora]MCW3816249.1 DUF4190 domain-containing protein [Micromonospora sp. DR5-3]TYC23936.1 DUF4190 domain-containing protein [Micromonospora sp. MP36]